MSQTLKRRQRTSQALVLVGYFILFLGILPAQTPTKPVKTAPQEDSAAIEAEVKRHIQELDSPIYKNREEALTKLQEMGATAVPTIRKVMSDMSLNTRMQLEAMLEEFVPTTNRYNAKFEAAMITTKAEQTTVNDVLRLLRLGAGFRFADRLGVDGKTTLSLDGGKKEALKVLNEMCTKVGIRWAQDYNSGCYRFYRGSAGTAPIEIYDGPFRIALNSMALNTNLLFGQEPSNNCYIRGQLDMEPTAEVVGVIFQPAVVEAIDDKKRSLLLKDTTVTNFQSSMNRRNFTFNLRVSLPAKDAKKIALLSLKIPIVVPSAIETVTVQIGKDTPKNSATSGGLEVKFVRIDEQRTKRYAVLHVVRKLPKTKTERPTEVMDQDIFFIAKDGSEEQAHSRVARQVAKDYEILRVEMPAGEFQAMTFAQVIEIETRIFEFKFKDIPLP